MCAIGEGELQQVFPRRRLLPPALAAWIMRLFRKREKKKGAPPSPYPDGLRPLGAAETLLPPPSRASAQLVAQVPAAVLQRIFAFVCPHSRDETYETCEESANDEGCMLCDLRDLSHCAQVSRAWRASAITLLYVLHPASASSPSRG